MAKQKVHGVLFFGKQGRAKVFVEGSDESISLAKGYTGTALHGDTVEIISLPPKKEIRSQKKKIKENKDSKLEELSSVELENF